MKNNKEKQVKNEVQKNKMDGATKFYIFGTSVLLMSSLLAGHYLSEDSTFGTYKEKTEIYVEAINNNFIAKSNLEDFESYSITPKQTGFTVFGTSQNNFIGLNFSCSEKVATNLNKAIMAIEIEELQDRLKFLPILEKAAAEATLVAVYNYGSVEEFNNKTSELLNKKAKYIKVLNISSVEKEDGKYTFELITNDYSKKWDPVATMRTIKITVEGENLTNSQVYEKFLDGEYTSRVIKKHYSNSVTEHEDDYLVLA